jgi:hypothetical protein
MISYITCVPTQSICGRVQLKNKNQIGAAIEDLETPPEDMSVQRKIYLLVNQNKWISYREMQGVRQINSKV